MKKSLHSLGVAAVTGLLLGWAALPAARAETREVRVYQQNGLSYLTLMVMQEHKLIERCAQEAGLPEPKVSWILLSGPTAVNDALLSGALDFGAGGIPSLITLWSKTAGSPLAVKGLGGTNTYPLILNTVNPAVKTVGDFTDKDKIAVTGVKVSAQALLLQMAAAKAFGKAKFDQLDRLTVNMSHPDALTALLSGMSEITAHFGSPPYQYQELANPKVHRVTDSTEIMGVAATWNVIYATSKFRQDNPKTFAAVVKAFQLATEEINKDKRAAAELFLRVTKSKETLDEILRQMAEPDVAYTVAPAGTKAVADFMAEVKRIPKAPASWQEMFFPEIHDLPGS